jgi:hypothetical protein
LEPQDINHICDILEYIGVQNRVGIVGINHASKTEPEYGSTRIPAS